MTSTTNKKIVKQLTKPGSRYIREIKYDATNDVVIFIGQVRQQVTANLRELLADADGPVITTADESTFPEAPEGWRYVNLTDPDKLQFDPAHYPVVLYKGITYSILVRNAAIHWDSLSADYLHLSVAASDIPNMGVMNIIGWNSDKKIVKQINKEGARYLWQISYNDITKGFTFTGQAKQFVTVPLGEL